ncbi:Pentatricopeptide repeat-containing protein [Glycine soja]
MSEKDVVSWSAMISGYAQHECFLEALALFQEMQLQRVRPDETALNSHLTCLRHYFNPMIHKHKIEANIKHYGCMVDLLGCAGLLKEAEELIKSMPMAPDVATWGALLGACRNHHDNEMGEMLGRKLIQLQPGHDGFHRGVMAQHRVVKTPGCSMIEANGSVHEFLAGDKTHQEINDIKHMLDVVAAKLKIESYVLTTSEVSLDIDEEEKETALFRHSEKLAVAFGLITISLPTPIRVTKNLRICNDCHTVVKLISKAFDREIVQIVRAIKVSDYPMLQEAAPNFHNVLDWNSGSKKNLQE